MCTLTNMPSSTALSFQTNDRMKPECVKFLLFLRVLLRYLQRKEDQRTYRALKLALHDCAARSRRHETGFENLTVAMKRLIPEMVSPQDLDRARAYMHLFVQKKHEIHQQKSPPAKVLQPILQG